jgi:hypothetical protein
MPGRLKTRLTPGIFEMAFGKGSQALKCLRGKDIVHLGRHQDHFLAAEHLFELTVIDAFRKVFNGQVVNGGLKSQSGSWVAKRIVMRPMSVRIRTGCLITNRSRRPELSNPITPAMKRPAF